MRHRTLMASVALAAAIALTGVVLPANPADAEPAWAPAAEATVHPGVQVISDAGQCTSNFVFWDASNVYLGVAAHCFGSDSDPSATDGCEAGSLPLGSEAEIEGASNPGTLAYSSWLTMQGANERDENTCAFNDFALVRVEPADHGSVNPTVPFWGGPVAFGADTSSGEPVYSYGNSSLRLGADALKPKQGYSLGEIGDGWSHDVYTATPGVPGDSGSAFLDENGDALGVLVTLQIAPLAGSNGVTDLRNAVNYMESHTSLDVNLGGGTEPFTNGGTVGLVTGLVTGLLSP